MILVLAVAWCLTSSVTVEALFVRPPSKVIPYPLRLTQADRLRAPYQGIAYDAGKAASLPGFALSLNAVFGDLDKRTFEALMSVYCGWSETKSQVKWRKGQKYTLLDFLPPVLQAVSGLYFRSSRRKQFGLPSFVGGPNDRVKELTEQDVLLAFNCWGFAWEVLFQADNKDVRKITVSTADPLSAWYAFQGPGFYLVQTSRANPRLLTDSRLRNRSIRGGDVLLLWHMIRGQVYLDHVAIVLDDDVYYEKSGSGDTVPFRINTWDGLTANFPPKVFFWEWRRLVRNRQIPNRNAASKLRSAADMFGLHAQVANAALPPERFSILSDLRTSVANKLSLTADSGEDGGIEAHTYTGIHVLEDLVFGMQTGRASLPPSAFNDRYMQVPQLPGNPYLSPERGLR